MGWGFKSWCASVRVDRTFGTVEWLFFSSSSELWKKKDDEPPPYLDATASTPSESGLSRPCTIPNIQPSNFISLNRPNEAIKGSWLIDPSLSIPSSFLPPLSADGVRNNLAIESKNGTVDVDVYLLSTSHSKTSTSKFISIHTQSSNGNVRTRLVIFTFLFLSVYYTNINHNISRLARYKVGQRRNTACYQIFYPLFQRFHTRPASTLILWTHSDQDLQRHHSFLRSHSSPSYTLLWFGSCSAQFSGPLQPVTMGHWSALGGWWALDRDKERECKSCLWWWNRSATSNAVILYQILYQGSKFILIC